MASVNAKGRRFHRTRDSVMAGCAALLCSLSLGAAPGLSAQATDGGTPQSTAAKPANNSASAELLAALSAQGIPSSSMLGTDARGVPILCGTDRAPTPMVGPGILPAAGTPPDNSRTWEAVPGVIRRDGIESFRMEVTVNTNVAAITFTCPPNLIPESGGTAQGLRDDGLGQDRVAGDWIWTSVRMRANTNFFTPPYFAFDSNSPAGLSFVSFGPFYIQEANGGASEFLVTPEVGLLDPLIPLTTARILTPGVQVTPHLINIAGTSREAQRYLRFLPSNLAAVTTALYQVIPDVFDFLTFFSIDHVEASPRLNSANFNAGVHTYSKINYAGTGATEFDVTSFWGSSGRLLGVNVLDTAERGVYSANLLHEILHQWLVFTDPSLELDDGTSHYNFRSGAGSLLGGTQFIDAPNGAVIVNCEEGRSGAHQAAPLDKYMMGLIDGGAVPPIKIYASSLPGPYLLCDQLVTNIVKTVTISDLQTAHGVRTPGPATAQRDFRLGFVIESHERLLNATELTFYEVLAKHCTKQLPASQPAPYIEQNWAPITKFFGEGATTWTSYVPSFVTPQITSVIRSSPTQITIRASGFPKASYKFEGSSNLVHWSALGSVIASADGNFQFTNGPLSTAQFYRAVWNE